MDLLLEKVSKFPRGALTPFMFSSPAFHLPAHFLWLFVGTILYWNDYITVKYLQRKISLCFLMTFSPEKYWEWHLYLPSYDDVNLCIIILHRLDVCSALTVHFLGTTCSPVGRVNVTIIRLKKWSCVLFNHTLQCILTREFTGKIVDLEEVPLNFVLADIEMDVVFLFNKS